MTYILSQINLLMYSSKLSNSTHMQDVDLKILVVCLHYQFHYLFLVPKDDLLCTIFFFFFKQKMVNNVEKQGWGNPKVSR